jgi:hypothetical protein
LNPFSTKIGVYLTFDEAGVKIATNAFRNSPGMDKEAPESINGRLSSFCAKARDPHVAGGEINKGEGIFVAAGASAFAVTNVHT